MPSQSEFGYALILDGATTEWLQKLTWPLTVYVYEVGDTTIAIRIQTPDFQTYIIQ